MIEVSTITRSQTMRIHQFHFSVAEGDAITNQMRWIRSVLAEIGIEGDIFAEEIKTGYPAVIRPFRPSELWNADLVLLHHSMGNPSLREILRIEVPKALVYHNITPEAFFAHDSHLAYLCALGRKQLDWIRPNVQMAFADSKYNAHELESRGYKKVELLPLFDLTSGPLFLSQSGKKKGSIHELLFVGRIAPHKNQSLLLQVLFYLHHIQPGKYRLHLVGRGDPVYTRYLHDLSKVLGLEEHVYFSGKVSEDQLVDLYSTATAFVCASQHEGFCIPLVEAMRYRLPIFAFPVTGIRETLGQAGVRMATHAPHQIAEILHTTLNRAEWVRAIVQGQDSRLKELQISQNPDRVQSTFLRFVDQLRTQPRHHLGLLPCQ